MFKTIVEDKLVFALWLPILVAVLLTIFAATGSAQTKVVGSPDINVESAGDLLKLKLKSTQMLNEINRFNVEELEPARDKAIAATTLFQEKQQMLQKAAKEVQTVQEQYTKAKEELESKTGCIMNEETMVLDCTEDK